MNAQKALSYLAECFLAMATVLRAVANLQAEDQAKIAQLEAEVGAIKRHLAQQQEQQQQQRRR